MAHRPKDIFGLAVSPGALVAGKYRVVEKIASGGMATVWKCMHEGLQHTVALKVLHPEMLRSGSVASRFVDEARVMAAIRHRNVARCWDIGKTDDGLPFMIMDYLEGDCFGDRLDKSPPLRIREALEIIVGCLSGLNAVHQKGVIHRDIKPDNIHLVEEDGRIYPKLIDFGIARIRRGASPVIPQAKVTVVGQLLGTPQYMSPEQARGARSIDARSDLFSIGAVIYEVVSGRTPFHAENMGDVIAALTRDDVPSILLHRPSLPSDLAALVMKSLASSPEDRFANAVEMKDALVAILEQMPQSELTSFAPPRKSGPGVGSYEPDPSQPPSTRSQQRSPAAPAYEARGADASGSYPHAASGYGASDAGGNIPSDGSGSYAKSFAEFEAKLSSAMRRRKQVRALLAVLVVLAFAFAGAMLVRKIFDGSDGSSADGSSADRQPALRHKVGGELRDSSGESQAGKNVLPTVQDEEPLPMPRSDEIVPLARDGRGPTPKDIGKRPVSGDVSTAEQESSVAEDDDFAEASETAVAPRRRSVSGSQSKRIRRRKSSHKKKQEQKTTLGHIVDAPDF